MRTDKLVKFLGLNLVKWLKTLPLVTILLGMRERGCIKIRAKTNVLLGVNAFRLRLGAENIGLRTPTSLLQKNMICKYFI